MPIRILIVEDQRIVREGLIALLEDEIHRAAQARLVACGHAVARTLDGTDVHEPDIPREQRPLKIRILFGRIDSRERVMAPGGHRVERLAAPLALVTFPPDQGRASGSHAYQAVGHIVAVPGRLRDDGPGTGVGSHPRNRRMLVRTLATQVIERVERPGCGAALLHLRPQRRRGVDACHQQHH